MASRGAEVVSSGGGGGVPIKIKKGISIPRSLWIQCKCGGEKRGAVSRFVCTLDRCLLSIKM
jgi:hypothetical protein